MAANGAAPPQDKNGIRKTPNVRRPVTAVRRLKQDYMMIVRDPVPYVEAAPLPSNILEWHYVIRGPENSPYYKGFYHGKLRFPPDYPFKPPSIYMITPSGRFRPNSRLCLSISDFHPDTWNPTWNLSTILTGLLSFMLENHSTYGSIVTTTREKKILAYKSLEFNLTDSVFCELFPDVVHEINDELDKRKEAEEKRLAAKAAKEEASEKLSTNNDQNAEGAEETAPQEDNAVALLAQGPNRSRFFWSLFYNLIAVLLLLCICYTVNLVLTNSNSSNQSPR